MKTYHEQSSVSVVIPAYNEETAIKVQIEKIQHALDMDRMAYEIVVVDDGSQDNTSNIALATGVKVLRHSTNKGYGSAIKTGITLAQYDIIAIIDADGTYPADQIPVMINKLKNADMVVGARIGEHVKIPLMRRPAKYILRCLASFIADQPIVDLNSGLRVFRRSCIEQYFPILSNRFSFTTTSTLALLADNYQVVYHPIDYYQRIGKSKIVPQNFVEFIILILRITMLFRPLKVFAPLALISWLMGMLKLVFDIFVLFTRNTTLDISVLYEPVVSTTTLLFLLTGLQVLLIGLIADGIIRRVNYYVAKPLVFSYGVDSIDLYANKSNGQRSISSKPYELGRRETKIHEGKQAEYT
ncbi:MAG: glycosyltransferase family 2 protein [Caldilineaceae bacterium]